MNRPAVKARNMATGTNGLLKKEPSCLVYHRINHKICATNQVQKSSLKNALNLTHLNVIKVAKDIVIKSLPNFESISHDASKL